MKNELNNPLPYILAGKSIFTVENLESSNRYTYKVYESKKTKGLFIVNALYNRKYKYIGIIKDNKFIYGKKSELNFTYVEVKGFEYVFRRLVNNTLLNIFKIYHSGKCGRCGRTLTTPESLESGFGSECIKKVIL